MAERDIAVLLDDRIAAQPGNDRTYSNAEDDRHTAGDLLLDCIDIAGVEAAPSVYAVARSTQLLDRRRLAPAPAGVESEILDRQRADILQHIQRSRSRGG